MILTGLAASMAVNALVTGLIVLKILKVFLNVKPTLIEQTLGTLNSRDTTLRQIIFIVIESGMALFAIQLVRVVFTSLPEVQSNGPAPAGLDIASNLIIGMHQMCNVIIRSIHFYSLCFTDNIYLDRASHQR